MSPAEDLLRSIAASTQSSDEAAQSGHALAVAHLIETTKGLNAPVELATYPDATDGVVLSYLARSAPRQLAQMALDRRHAGSGIQRTMTSLETVAMGGQRGGKALTQRFKEAFRR